MRSLRFLGAGSRGLGSDEILGGEKDGGKRPPCPIFCLTARSQRLNKIGTLRVHVSTAKCLMENSDLLG